MLNQVYLSLGSNIGDRMQHLQRAVEMLQLRPENQLLAISPVFETEPVGGVQQRSFYNIALKLTTSLNAADLLKYLHVIERSLRRQRLIHWGPRTIDLDILYFNNEEYRSATLKIPHPEIKNRRFVIEPLLTIVTEDDFHQRLTDLLATTPDHNWLKIIREKEDVNPWIR
ncbi:2-amino-4-hydroxy-6-hydroxymethyldihydropteridine diphosphokinase [Lactobacillus alvi]|uniref:2-amino-4-hydroxy-6-hydroxymethyldihydropteridine diphosphokinase n=1 Tax=Limosilactobacillus alvi TaxID=990412 RepID=A0ABS2EN45_9LACO|nr:2-amino-4-hydroxy-6-hydroxymethyldihydropteridine diphosphokinase [Limosilactobacillus alvi]MBM6753914.1 2-amino-4-hydroxy-6-hydroxymethyldihydropteridine diphosphokinase [Limosilactobacillus alvi]